MQIAKQESETQIPQKWDWVEASIWTERMLSALGNGVKGNKWFSLWDKVIRPSTLEIAWKKVKSNDGAAGVDRVTIERFSSHAEKYLGELEKDLREGLYQTMPVRRVYIPKGKSALRPLGIAAIKDRIVQTALKMVMEPIFENEFIDTSYGFRPGRDAKDALREVDRLIKEGNVWVVDADLQNYFDTIPHDKLMDDVERCISDGRVLDITNKLLKQGVMEDGVTWESTQGTPQGSCLSPLLSNLYLHGLDQHMLARGFQMRRFADDFVVMCRSEFEASVALEEIKEWVIKHGLKLHPDKTRIGNCQVEGQGFEFLGYRFEAGQRYVRKKSMNKLKDEIRTLTKRTCGRSIQKVVDEVNPKLRGWYNYFKHAKKWTLEKIDGFVRRRLRAILRKQEKRPGRGRTLQDHMKWRNAYFAGLGLFTMQAALASDRQSR